HILLSGDERPLRQNNINQISRSELPPLDRRPRLFQPKGLLHLENDYLKDHELKVSAMKTEIEHLSQITHSATQ
ncbi:unnamed protein product, partial [Rotaria sordida]